MKSALPPATKEEKRRFRIIKQEIGCLLHHSPADAHHLLRAGKRISHAATIPLCPECHFAIHNRKAWFTRHYGSDKDLLAETDRKVKAYEKNTTGRAV